MNLERSDNIRELLNPKNDYSKLRRSIAILITDYNLEHLKQIPDYMTKWNIREEKHSKIILTDMLEIYIIEANKAKDFSFKENKVLNSWLQFINNPEVISDMENEEIKKAKRVLEEISQDERERRLTELRQKYIMDQNAVHSHGYDKGLEVGIKQGIERNRIEIAKKMKAENIDMQIIIKITGLTEEEINKII